MTCVTSSEIDLMDERPEQQEEQFEAVHLVYTTAATYHLLASFLGSVLSESLSLAVLGS